MTRATIFAPSAIGWRKSDQSPCREAIEKLDLTQYDLVNWRYRAGERENTMYARGLAAVWHRPNSIIIIEHDMVPTQAMIDELADCPNQLCIQAYWISPVETHGQVPIHNVGVRNPVYDYIQHGSDGNFPAYADWAGPGLAKLGLEFRQNWIDFPPVIWSSVEKTLNVRARAVHRQWHVHRPAVEYTHGFTHK